MRKCRNIHASAADAERDFQRARQALEAGSHAQAIRWLRRVLRAEPDHLGALETQAKLFWKLERLDDALGAIDRLVVLNPYEPGYFYLRGLICQSKGQVGAAAEAFERCVAAGESPMHEAARASLAEIDAWQRELLSQWLREDTAFRVRFRRDPAAACAERGLRYRPAAAVRPRLEARRLSALNLDRPS